MDKVSALLALRKTRGPRRRRIATRRGSGGKKRRETARAARRARARPPRAAAARGRRGARASPPSSASARGDARARGRTARGSATRRRAREGARGEEAQRESAHPTMPHSRLTSASRCGGRGGNQWFTGKIAAIRGDRLYDILYDDGERAFRVAESMIRRCRYPRRTLGHAPRQGRRRARADAAEAEAKAAEERRQRLAAEAQAAEAERKLRAAEAAAADKKRREAAAAAAERRRRAANEAINAFDNYGYTKLNWGSIQARARGRRESCCRLELTPTSSPKEID